MAPLFFKLRDRNGRASTQRRVSGRTAPDRRPGPLLPSPFAQTPGPMTRPLRLAVLALAGLAAPALAAQDFASAAPDVLPAAAATGPATEAPASILVAVERGPAAQPAPAVEIEEADTRYGIGLGGTWRVQGISGTYDLTDTITAEAILGVLGNLTSVGARAWYRFDKLEAYDLYAYGGASFYRYSVFSETALGLGGGAGVQASLPKLLNNPDFPPIYISADAGLTYASFNTYGFSAFTAGSGIHYRF